MEDLPGPGYLADASDGQTGGGKWDYVRKHKLVGLLMKFASVETDIRAAPLSPSTPLTSTEPGCSTSRISKSGRLTSRPSKYPSTFS